MPFKPLDVPQDSDRARTSGHGDCNYKGALRLSVGRDTFPGMGYILHLWQAFLALHPWGYVIAAALALLAIVKRKAIGVVTSAVWMKSDSWF